jgi:hypothetical protein
MHPLLSQLSNQSVAAGKPLTAKDEQVPHLHPERMRESGGGHGEEALASFQHIFDAKSDAKPAGNLLDDMPDDLANNTDQPKEVDVVQAAELEIDIPDPSGRHDGLADLQLDQPQVEITSGAAIIAAVPEHPKQQPSGTRELVKAARGTALSESETPAIPARILEFGHQSVAKGQAAQASAVNLFEATASKPPQTANEVKGPISEPILWQKPAQSAPTFPSVGRPELQMQQLNKAQNVQPNAIQIPLAAQDSALIKTAVAEHNDHLPRSAKFETAIRSTSDQTLFTSTRPMTNKPPENGTWVAGQIRPASDQHLTLKTIAAEPLAHSSMEIAPSPTAQHGTIPARTDLPVHIARQLAEVAQHLPARPVEITLSPEELGRVRLSLVTSEHGIVVNVLAERPETLDLMRRHIDQLVQEFQSLGYEDIGFSFSSTEHGAPDEPDTQAKENKMQEVPLDPDDAGTKSAHIHLSTGATTGLDLRL